MGGSISKSFRSPSPSVAPRLLSSSPVSLVYATRTPLDSELHESCGLSQRDAKQDKRLKPVKQLGLANIGNTCYSNSVLQVLFHCKPFRSRCIAELRNVKPDSLVAVLAHLFIQLEQSQNSSRQLSVDPSKFIHKLKMKSDLFRSPSHHDAHEFFSYLLNAIAEEVAPRVCEASQRAGHHSPSVGHNGSRVSHQQLQSTVADDSCYTFIKNSLPSSPKASSMDTWIHDLFQGVHVYETRCLCCENVTRHEETFLDIPIECNYNNLEDCLQCIASTQRLKGKDKYFCDFCGSLQDAERRLRFDRLPAILTIHMKRFEVDEMLGRCSRVAKRVEFPLTLSFPTSTLSEKSFRYSVPEDIELPFSDVAICETREQSVSPDRGAACLTTAYPEAAALFDLFGVVVHIGTRTSHGHYVSCVRSNTTWWLFDDHNTKIISESDLQAFYGSSSKSNESSSDGAQCGYLLFYKKRYTDQFSCASKMFEAESNTNFQKHQKLVKGVRKVLYSQ